MIPIAGAQINSKSPEFIVEANIPHQDLQDALNRLTKEGYQFLPPPNKSIIECVNVGTQDYVTLVMVKMI